MRKFYYAGMVFRKEMQLDRANRSKLKWQQPQSAPNRARAKIQESSQLHHHL